MKAESQIRDELLELAIRDLLGPAGGPNKEPSLDAEFGRLMKPTDLYLLGMLVPQDKALPQTELHLLTFGTNSHKVAATPVTAGQS